MYQEHAENFKPLLILLDAELQRQYKKWGVQNHNETMWMNILMEEVGEASRALMEACFRSGDWNKYRDELIQVAAVALSAIENFDRQRRDGIEE